MKTIFKKALIAAATIGCFGFAQAQKIAHLSFDSLVSLMPETKIATEAAQTYLKGLEQELVAMQTELEGKFKDYQEKAATMSDLIKQAREAELQRLQNNIQEFQRQAEIDYKRKQTDLTGPIIEKAKKGIEAVAKEGGYKYVLDTSPERTQVLFSEPADDILMAVKKKLDSMPAAVIPGVAPPGTGGIKPPPPANKPAGTSKPAGK